MPTPSPQQQDVIDWAVKGSGSAFVEAVAGAGKTTTLLMLLAQTRGYVSFAAYNRKIAAEIKAKVAALNLGTRVQVGTFHSFGLRAWRRVHPQVRVAEGHEKTDMMIERFQIEKPLRAFVPKLISLAKQSAAGLYWQIDDVSKWYAIIDHHDMLDDIEIDDNAAVDPNPNAFDDMVKRAINLAQDGLRWHREIGTELMDFDDMIWLPTVTGTRMFEVDWIFVDEAQDTNPIRRALARKMLKRNGRAVFVGDRHQAIYGFTGADNDAIDHIVRDFRCVTLPLTVTYRCPQTVVAEAQQIVSHITAHESAPLGTVARMPEHDFWKIAAHAANENGDRDLGLKATDAVLCRVTKPLVEMAFSLIKRGVACHVEGRDIGMGLLKLVEKFKTNDLEQMMDRLEAYAARQCEKLKAKGRETQAEALQDRVDTIKVMAEGCPDVDCIRKKISDMFQDSENERKPTLTLSTVHKSKGREWNRVFILGRNMYMPSKWARQQWQIDQENNLIYVAITRSQSELVYVNVEGM